MLHPEMVKYEQLIEVVVDSTYHKPDFVYVNVINLF